MLHCPSFDEERSDLLAGVFALLRPYGYTNPSSNILIGLLLYSYKDLANDINRNMLQLTLQFIRKTCNDMGSSYDGEVSGRWLSDGLGQRA